MHRKFEMRSLSGGLAVPEIIAIGVFVGVENPNIGEEVVGGCGWHHSNERW